MPADKDLVRPAAVFADVPLGPGEGPGHIANVFRMPHRRRQAIVRAYHADAVARERAAQNRIGAELILAPLDPAAAVYEEQHRKIDMTLGKIDIETMAHRVRIRSLMVGDVLDHLRFERFRLSGCLGAPEAERQKDQERYPG